MHKKIILMKSYLPTMISMLDTIFVIKMKRIFFNYGETGE